MVYLLQVKFISGEEPHYWRNFKSRNWKMYEWEWLCFGKEEKVWQKLKGLSLAHICLNSLLP